ncbi:RNA polymerase sigma factor [Jatrophihabitans sp.]|uniref:RNA polymerase sigma factor n=1 Tax=Jatrophihabitans sp. TaxID=1932789 RepID=UPI002C1861E0|nr:RNA polymerase sigma factor [Jatrophihabitans sp.]
MSSDVRSDAALSGVTPDSTDGFAAWVKPHLSVLRVLADRQVGPAAGADVVQEALLRAWRRRDTFDPDRGTVRAWLVAILLDRARRHRLRRHRSWPDSQDSPVAPETGAAPSADRIDVERAVARLPRRQRQVITLHYLADLSVTEVAAVLRISESSVKTHLGAARSALRAWLEIA